MTVEEIMETEEFKNFVKLVAEHTGREVNSVSVTKNTIIVDGYSYCWRSR